MPRSIEIRTIVPAIALLVASYPVASQEAVAPDALTIGVYVAATDSTDASDTSYVVIPITVVAAIPPALAFPDMVDTLPRVTYWPCPCATTSPRATHPWTVLD